MSFEDALAELEQIVRGLEGGQQKLEDAIAAYERGAALRRHCEAKLAEAEARVAAIVEHADGTLGTAAGGLSTHGRSLVSTQTELSAALRRVAGVVEAGAGHAAAAGRGRRGPAGRRRCATPRSAAASGCAPSW